MGNEHDGATQDREIPHGPLGDEPPDGEPLGDEPFDGPPPLEAGREPRPGYAVVGHLHRSGGYDVYDAWSGERSCRVICKLPRPDRAHEADVVARLLREGRLLQSLTHPHIVRAYEVHEEPSPLVVLETLTGQTLDHLIESRANRLPLREVAHLGLHLCSAIHYLHRKGVLHLDLKPSNVVSERGLAKLLDLSIAHPPGPGEKGSGTLEYMSPEQARGDVLGPAADVWGIGAVLHEVLTGDPPFDAPEEENRYEQLEVRAEPVRRYARVPAAFASLVDRCLEPDPNLRPSLAELTDGLSAHAGSPAAQKG